MLAFATWGLIGWLWVPQLLKKDPDVHWFTGAVFSFGTLFLLGCAYNLLFSFPYWLRTRRHRAELKRRYQIPEFAGAVLSASAEISQEHGPDWILILSGRALPHGGALYLRVDIKSETPEGSMNLIQVPFDIASAGGCYTKHAGTLSSAVIVNLLEILKSEFPDKIVDEGYWKTRDGFPADLAILRKSPRLEKRITCNAAAISPEHIVLQLLQLSATVRQPLLTGSCDSSGGIKIGDM